MKLSGTAIYLAAAFGLAWGPWLWAMGHGWRPGDASVPAIVYLGACAPAAGAVAARVLAEGRSFADAGLDIQPERWPLYLAAWFWPIAGAVVVLAVAQALGLADVDWTMGRGAQALAASEGLSRPLPRTESLWYLGLLDALPATPVFFGEEFGWRAYLQRRLAPGRPLQAAAWTGIIWSLWHLPLNLQGYNFPQQPLGGLAVYTISCILLSVLLGWLMAASGSIWCVSLAHAAINTAGSTMVFLGTGGQHGLVVQFMGVLGWLPMILTILALMRWGRLLPSLRQVTP